MKTSFSTAPVTAAISCQDGCKAKLYAQAGAADLVPSRSHQMAHAGRSATHRARASARMELCYSIELAMFRWRLVSFSLANLALDWEHAVIAKHPHCSPRASTIFCVFDERSAAPVGYVLTNATPINPLHACCPVLRPGSSFIERAGRTFKPILRTRNSWRASVVRLTESHRKAT